MTGGHSHVCPVTGRRCSRMCFQGVVFEPYRLTFGSVPLWHMVYFKGGPK